MNTIPYEESIGQFFDQKGLAHTINPQVDHIDVAFPESGLSKIKPGQFFSWYNQDEGHGWAICDANGIVEWLTTPTFASAAPAAKVQPIRRQFSFPSIKITWKQAAAFGLAILLLFAAFSAASSSPTTPSTDATATQAIGIPTIAATGTPEISLLSKAEQACGAGAKVIDIQLVNGEYTLVGSLQDIYPNETGKTTWYIAEEGNLPIGTLAWLFRGADAEEEFRKAMELDSSRISTVKKCDGSDCSTLWQTVYGLGNSFKNDKLYGDGKNPAYLKNVVEAMFWAMKGWVNSATLDINAGREFNRCISLQPIADMMEISKEDQDFLKSNGGRAEDEDLPPSGGNKNTPTPTSTPLIITATPGMAVGFGQAAYDKYNQIVGSESANMAFTVNDGAQCYSTITASWADFKTESPLNEVLRILGPNGFKIEENGGSYTARSFDKDGSGRSACVSITGIETNYPEGVWRISSVGKVSTLHWIESYPNNAEEIKTGVAWIYPIWKDYETPLATETTAPNAPPVIYVGELGPWMSQNGLQELTVPCPAEPLTGQVYLSNVTIDFANYSGAMAYSKSRCDDNGQLHFVSYDPGRPDLQFKVGTGVWAWPMNKKVAIMPTEVGAPTYPDDGASMTLDQMLGYAQQAKVTQISASCTNYTNGAIPGWPNAVPMQVIDRYTTWNVDFSAVAGNVSTNDLCHSYNTANGYFNGRSLRLQSWQPTDQWTIDNQGPWWRYNGWWLSPFK